MAPLWHRCGTAVAPAAGRATARVSESFYRRSRAHAFGWRGEEGGREEKEEEGGRRQGGRRERREERKERGA